MHSPIPICRLTDADFTAGEQLDTMRPAVLALGLDRDPPQLRGMLVTADTLSNEWAGKLEGDKARFVQTEACTTLRCYAEMEITTASQGDDITLVLRQKLTWKVTLTLTLHRDPDARLDKELEPMRER
jgi:hypothetical protein